MRYILLFLTLVSVSLANSDHLDDFNEDTVLKVYTKEFRPLVFKDGDKIKGMDIDLLDAITSEMGVEYELIVKDTVTDVHEGVAIAEAEMGMAGITITAERESKLDFSYPYIKTGLGILILDKKKNDVWDNAKIIAVSIGTPILYLTIFLIIVAHGVWLMEKGSDAINDDYNPGILESLWFVYITITTIGYGDITPKKWLSKFLIVIITLFGFGFFANIVAKMSAESVLKKQAYYIQDEHGLRGKKVATEEGTSSVSAISKLGAAPIQCKSLRESYGMLMLGDVDAVVFDKLALIDFAKTINYKNIVVLEREFEEQQYGIALQQGSFIRENVNDAILKLQESGKLEQIRSRWIK